MNVYYEYLMCRGHWGMVPKPIQSAVYNAWASGRGRGTPEHAAVIDAAIQAVNRKLGA